MPSRSPERAPRVATGLAVGLAALAIAPALAQAATRVPASVDPSGRSDVTAKLRRFVDSVPDGSTVVFRRGAIYRIDGTLQWRDRRRVTLDGNGATLVARAHGGPNRAHVRLVDGGDWTIRDLRIRGSNRFPGRVDHRYQWQHGFDLRGVDGAKLERVDVSDVLGDAIYVGLSTSRPRWSQDVAVVDSTGRRSGRMGISVTAGRRVTIDGGRWSNPALSTFDIEPNGPPGGADRILIKHTTIGAGSRDTALSITGSGPVSNVTLLDNILIGRPLIVRADQHGERPSNIVVRGNRSTVTFTGPPPAAMLFRNVDRVTVAGNRQPLRPGSSLAVVATDGSTAVRLSGQGPHLKLGSRRGSIAHPVGSAAAGAALLIGLSWSVRRALLRRRLRPLGPIGGP